MEGVGPIDQWLSEFTKAFHDYIKTESTTGEETETACKKLIEVVKEGIGYFIRALVFFLGASVEASRYLIVEMDHVLRMLGENLLHISNSKKDHYALLMSRATEIFPALKDFSKSFESEHRE